MVREHIQALRLGEDVGPGILIEGSDKRFYWRFETAAGDAWLVNSDQIDAALLSPDEAAATQSGCCGETQPVRNKSEQDEAVLGSGSAATMPILGARSASYNISGIPYHYQINDWYCCLACIQMLFSYWGEEIGQHDLGDVADEDPAFGVYHSGIVRATLFSGMSTAIQNPALQGYSERKLGYACSDYWWGDMAEALRLEALKTLAYEGYPVLTATYFSDISTNGHCRIVKGYDDNLDVIVVHDPWFAGAWAGPNLLIDQTVFMSIWIDWSWGEALLIMPWKLRYDFPATVAVGDTFSVDLKVKYPGPFPFEGRYPSYDCWAEITLPAGLSLASGMATVSLPNLDTGDSTVVSWEVVADGPAGEYGMAFHAQGTVDDPYQAYSDSIGAHGYETVEVTSGPAATWESEERLTNDTAGSHTCFPSGRAMVLETDGTAHVVWEDTRDGDSEIYYKSRSGDIWGSAVRLTTSSGLSWRPCIAQGADRHLHIAWVDTRDGNHEIYYKSWDPAGGWSSDERVTAYSEGDFHPTIAAGDTAVYIAWERRLGGLFRAHAVYVSERTALGWSAPFDVDASSARDSFRPSLAHGVDGLLHLVYERHTSNTPNELEKVVYRSWDGLTWSGRTGLSSTLSYSRQPAIAAGSDSTLHVVWRDGENLDGDIFYITYDGSAWQPVEQIAVGGPDASSASVAVDGTGDVHIVWEDNRHGDSEIYYKTKDSGGWSDEDRLTRAVEPSLVPTVAATEAGEVCVVWTDFRHGDSEVYFRSSGAWSRVPGIPGQIPRDVAVYLSRPYPVPSAGEVQFAFQLGQTSMISLEVFDVMGHHVRTLASGVFRAGSHPASWDGTTSSGQEASSGVYFILCETPHGKAIRRAVMVR
jgi:hypothetical protein